MKKHTSRHPLILKLKQYMRKEMEKLPTDKQSKKLSKPYGNCYSQAKFDVLLDIDIGLGLGVFIKNRRKKNATPDQKKDQENPGTESRPRRPRGKRWWYLCCGAVELYCKKAV